MRKKILSIVLVVAILIANVSVGSIFSTIASAESNIQQIEYEGGWSPANYETDHVLENDRVAVSKTISPTEDENFFDITLKVVAKQRVIDQSVDVVIVMDNSNTMNATHQNIYPGTSGYKESDARLSHAKKAINMFVDKYAADKNISKDRRFSLVTFNSYANTVIPLTTLNSTESATTIKNTVNSITAPTGNRVRFTNIEGGLQLAKNILSQSEAIYKYVIFLTDGFPTTYIESGRDSTQQIVGYDTYMTGSYNSSKINQDGYFADSVSKKLVIYGANYSDKAADRADDVAESLKDAGINIFSIGIDVGVQTIPEYLEKVKNTSFTTIDRRSENYVIGTTKESYQNWLSHSIAGGTLVEKAGKTELIHRYAEGNSETQLDDAFANILADIELIPAETMQQAYTIDPMSDYVDFIEFYDKAGNLTDKIINSEKNTEVATFDDENDVINWVLSDTENHYIDDDGNHVLYIRYKVRLKNEVEGFIPSTAFETNETTTFYYKTVDITSGEPLYGDNHINYPIPQVEGYLGSFEFIKKDAETEESLQGAEFTLHHHDASCDVCQGLAEIRDMTATSDANGKVSFINIPSGHEYVLIETKSPDGYQQGSNHIVNVAYGKTYIHGKEVTPTENNIITNQKIKPAKVKLTAEKTLIGRTLKDKEFKFILKGDLHDDAEIHDYEYNNLKGVVEFEEIIFDQVGTHTFNIYEEKGNDRNIVYDNKIYTVQFDVTLSEDFSEYVVETKIDGIDVENDTAPLPLKFENRLRQSTSVTLTAKKYLDGQVPEGTFTFELYDEYDNLLQTKHNIGEDITFDDLTFTEEGVYTYKIIEGHECVGHPDGTDEHHIFFDHSVYNAVVTVTADENSEGYITDVEYYLSGKRSLVNEIVFENHVRKDATLKLNGLKTLDGATPNDGEFTFVLKDENDTVLQQVTNDENGIIEFDTLTFNKVGYSEFTISELNMNDSKIVYDETIYTIGVITEALHINPEYYIEVNIVQHNADKDIMMLLSGSNLELEKDEFIIFENTTVKDSTEPTSNTTEPTTENTEPTSNTTEPTTESTEPTDNTSEPTEDEDVIVDEELDGADKNQGVSEAVTNTVENAEDDNTSVTSPQTGNKENIAFWILLFVFSGLAIFVVSKKRKAR